MYKTAGLGCLKEGGTQPGLITQLYTPINKTGSPRKDRSLILKPRPFALPLYSAV